VKGLISQLLIISLMVISSSLVGAAEQGETPQESKLSGQVTFNFIDVDLPVLAKFVSDSTGKNFIFDERLKGKITIIAPSKLSLDEAFKLFSSVLEFKGFTLIPSGVNAYKIIPSKEAKEKGIDVLLEGVPVNDQYIVRLIQLEHISSEEALIFLRPIVSRDGHISTFKPGNLLLVVDSALNIGKILKIIENIDIASALESPEMIYLQHAPAEDIAKVLNEGMKSFTKTLAGKSPIRREGAKAVADTRLNAVILFGPRSDIESMKKLIAMLDVPSPLDQGRINVYFLENADAEELEKVLEGVIKDVSVSAQKAAKGKKLAAPFLVSGKIIITADKATNSLIIVASPSDYNNLVQVIKQLDKRRRQVYVEAMIVEASIDKLKEMGVKWRITATKDDEPIFVGGVGEISSSTIQSIISGLSGLSLGGLGNFLDIPITIINSDGTTTTSTITVPGFAAIFNLDQFRDAINVLSTPQILTSDNREAEILVGENVPFVTDRDVTQSDTVLTSVERTDVGIILRITPQITEGDYVKLDIYQEISSVKDADDVVLIAVGPTTTKRSTNTSVVVQDTQTVVIGGLMEERSETQVDKVPLLGDIPLLGWLFKSTRTRKEKTNLLVFLTPHIVRDADAMESITDIKKKQFGDRILDEDVMEEIERGSGTMSQSESNTTAQPSFVSGELLVKFKAAITAEGAEEIFRDRGASVISYMEGISVYHIQLKDGETVREGMDFFNALPEVDYAEPNYTIRTQ
jgi:general secretion pathway protein D